MSTDSHFFALLSRMRHIERWSLMRSSSHDNLAEHSLEVAMIAHALATLANIRHGASLDADRAALLAIYHDASEIVTGDMPTPVKYHDEAITSAYKAVEGSAAASLLATLPEDMRAVYAEILTPGAETEDDVHLLRLVKAADKISAYVKCVDEDAAGNREFRSAKKTIAESLDAMAAELPEVADFMAEFLPSYGSTLDELLG